MFLLNKCNGTAEKVRLVLPKPAASSITVVTLADTAAADVQGSEQWGTVQQPRQLVCVTGVCEFKLRQWLSCHRCPFWWSRPENRM